MVPGANHTGLQAPTEIHSFPGRSSLGRTCSPPPLTRDPRGATSGLPLLLPTVAQLLLLPLRWTLLGGGRDALLSSKDPCPLPSLLCGPGPSLQKVPRPRAPPRGRWSLSPAPGPRHPCLLGTVLAARALPGPRGRLLRNAVASLGLTMQPPSTATQQSPPPTPPLPASTG